jgi:hypothetical protein
MNYFNLGSAMLLKTTFAVFVLNMAASITFTSSARATPADGDYASFDITVTDSQGQVHKGVAEYLLDHYDSFDKTFNQTTTITLDGATDIRETRVYESQLVSEATIKDTFDHCQKYGGDLGSTQTGVGVLNTCLVPVAVNGVRGINWFAHVPFGLAKLTSIDAYGATQLMILKNYRNQNFNKQIL